MIQFLLVFSSIIPHSYSCNNGNGYQLLPVVAGPTPDSQNSNNHNNNNIFSNNNSTDNSFKSQFLSVEPPVSKLLVGQSSIQKYDTSSSLMTDHVEQDKKLADTTMKMFNTMTNDEIITWINKPDVRKQIRKAGKDGNHHRSACCVLNVAKQVITSRNIIKYKLIEQQHEIIKKQLAIIDDKIDELNKKQQEKRKMRKKKCGLVVFMNRLKTVFLIMFLCWIVSEIE